MIISGLVTNVRDGDFVDQKTKEKILMLYVDVADETVSGVVQTSMQLKDVAVRPDKYQRVTAEVARFRPVNFGGGGVSFTVKNLRVVETPGNGNGGVPPAPPRAK